MLAKVVRNCECVEHRDVLPTTANVKELVDWLLDSSYWMCQATFVYAAKGQRVWNGSRCAMACVFIAFGLLLPSARCEFPYSVHFSISLGQSRPAWNIRSTSLSMVV